MNRIYINDWSAWAPGLETREDWQAWSEGRSNVDRSKGTPKLAHLPPISRRRLSQLSKMILQAGHELCERNGVCRTVLCSRYGEIGQQNSITLSLIETGEVRPSAFSLSVFNTPVSLLSIHEKNHEAATVLHGGAEGLTTGLLSALAELLVSGEKDVMLIFADELLPEDYASLDEGSLPFAFALRLGSSGTGIPVEIVRENRDGAELLMPAEPLSLLRWIVSGVESPLEISGSGCAVTLSVPERL